MLGFEEGEFSTHRISPGRKRTQQPQDAEAGIYVLNVLGVSKLRSKFLESIVSLSWLTFLRLYG
jgi:hypothetical protein